MTIKPVKVEYDLRIMNHTMKAVVDHISHERKVSFYLDDKEVAQKIVAGEDILSDDKCIDEIVKNYCEHNTGMLVDLFTIHQDKILLTRKKIDVIIENFGIQLMVHVTVEKNRYVINVSANYGDDSFMGTFKAESFSEVLEKLRLFINTLDGVSDNLSEHISELSSDKIVKRIRWEEEPS